MAEEILMCCPDCRTTTYKIVCYECGANTVPAPLSIAHPSVRCIEWLAAIAEHYKHEHSKDAPGHCHNIEGRWDADGTECEWCKMWKEIRGFLAANDADERPAPARKD